MIDKEKGGGKQFSVPKRIVCCLSVNRQTSVLGASAWMLIISGLLFWLPVLGPLLGGVVGGKKAGRIGNALLAAMLPAIVLGVCLSLLATTLTGVPIIGVLAGISGTVLVIGQIGPLLVGAVIGAVLS